MKGVKYVFRVRVIFDTEPTALFQFCTERELLVLREVGAGWVKVQICILLPFWFCSYRWAETREAL